MPDNRKYLSKFTFPNGQTYYLKDEEARQLLASGGAFIVAWDGNAAPDVSKIPAGVVVSFNSTTYTGTLAANAETVESKGFYLVKSGSGDAAKSDIYDEYVVVSNGGVASWEKLGSTSIDLSSLGELAYKDNVTLNKGTAVSAMGANTTFTTTVTPTKKKYKASAQITGGTITTTKDTVVKSITPTSRKLETTTIPNITVGAAQQIEVIQDVGTASTWAFDVDDTNETLTISGANGTAPTKAAAPISVTSVTAGDPITVATGVVSNNGAGSDVVTGFGISATAEVLLTAESGDAPTVSVTFAESTDADAVELVTDIPADAVNTAAAGDAVSVVGFDQLSISLQDKAA